MIRGLDFKTSNYGYTEDAEETKIQITNPFHPFIPVKIRLALAVSNRLPIFRWRLPELAAKDVSEMTVT